MFLALGGLPSLADASQKLLGAADKLTRSGKHMHNPVAVNIYRAHAMCAGRSYLTPQGTWSQPDTTLVHDYLSKIDHNGRQAFDPVTAKRDEAYAKAIAKRYAAGQS